jgi:hypothetical protein
VAEFSCSATAYVSQLKPPTPTPRASPHPSTFPYNPIILGQVGQLCGQGSNWVMGKVGQGFQVGHMCQLDQVGQVGQVSRFIRQGGVGHLEQVGKWVRRV